MGSLFKSKSEAIVDKGALEAWQTARPYHQQALSGIGDLATQVSQNPAYSGQRVADLNPYQTGSADNLGNFANTTSGFSQNFLNAGQGNLDASAGVGTNYQNILNRASMDPTQMIMAQAGQYANNPYTDGLIDSANRDVSRQLNEQALPSLARGFAGTGNTNSTRAGVESAITQRGAADRMADTAAGIRSQFFGQGLNMAQNQYNQGLNNMMNANQGLLNAGQYGGQNMFGAQNYMNTNFGQGQAAGGMYQNQQQNVLNGNMAQFNESIQNPLSVYNSLSGAAANTQAKTTAGVATQPSIISQVAAVGQAAAGAYGSFKSDVRMKENIEKVGTLPSGLNVYEFDYKPQFKDQAGHGRFLGVMAQEAQKVFPDAVIMEDDGYYAVDYSKIN